MSASEVRRTPRSAVVERRRRNPAAVAGIQARRTRRPPGEARSPRSSMRLERRDQVEGERGGCASDMSPGAWSGAPTVHSAALDAAMKRMLHAPHRTIDECDTRRRHPDGGYGFGRGGGSGAGGGPAEAARLHPGRRAEPLTAARRAASRRLAPEPGGDIGVDRDEHVQPLRNRRLPDLRPCA